MNQPDIDVNEPPGFLKRNCPLCQETSRGLVATMDVATLMKSNPGYNESWFVDDTIPQSTVCSVVRCKKCRFIYSDSRPDDSLTEAYYNYGIDGDFSRRKIESNGKRNRLIETWAMLHSFTTKSELKVLDYGAGWGDFLAIARSINVEVSGLEFDQRKIEFMKSMGVPAGDSDFIGERAPFDVFVCNQVLEHVNDPRGVIRGMRELLTPEAIGFISVPCYSEKAISQEVAALMRNENPSKDFDPIGHLNYFSPMVFRTFLKEEGFDVLVNFVGGSLGIAGRKREWERRGRALLQSIFRASHTKNSVIVKKRK